MPSGRVSADAFGQGERHVARRDPGVGVEPHVQQLDRAPGRGVVGVVRHQLRQDDHEGAEHDGHGEHVIAQVDHVLREDQSGGLQHLHDVVAEEPDLEQPHADLALHPGERLLIRHDLVDRHRQHAHQRGPDEHVERDASVPEGRQQHVEDRVRDVVEGLHGEPIV